MRGIEARVLERAVSRPARGTGVYLPANAVRAIGELGLSSGLAERAHRVSRQRFLDQRGRVLMEVDLDEVWGPTGPCLALPHADLHDVLGAGLPVERGSTITDLDAATADHSLVVGADGVRSWLSAPAARQHLGVVAVPDGFVPDHGHPRGQGEHEQGDGDGDAGGGQGHGDRDDDAREGDQQQVERVDAAGEGGVQEVEPQQVDRDRDRHGEQGAGRRELGVVLEEVRRGVQARSHGDDRAEQRDVAVAPAEGPRAVRVQEVAAGDDEVRPPQPERHGHAGDAERGHLRRPAGHVDERPEGGRGAEQALAEGDDHHQAVALGDVVGVPRGAAADVLGDERADQLDQDEDHDPGEHHADARVGEREEDPADLRDGEGEDEDLADLAPVGVLPGRPHPLGDHRHPHDHVAQHHHAVVDVLAVLERGEHPGQAERQHDDAHHLHHRGEAVHPVVGVVRRGEPREVDPGPRHRERREAEPDDPRAHVAGGEEVGQLVGGGAERDHERQVEQQLQRRRRAAAFVRVAPGHRDGGVPDRALAHASGS